MGHQIISDSKLQFYATDMEEVYRSLGVFNFIERKIGGNVRERTREIIGSEKYDEFVQTKKSMSMDNMILAELIKNKNYDAIEELYKEFCLFKDVVIADLFAGEGEWLKIYIRLLGGEKGKIKSIGNELEENRFKTMTKGGLVDKSYNLAFEDLQLPKKIISLMLFNPPYGMTNGERNVRRYLRMILEREYMSNESWILCALKTDDIVNCSDLFTQYFEVEKTFMYKFNPEEFKKFGQQMVYLKIREKPLDLNNINDLALFKDRKENFEKYAEKEVEFQDFFYGYLRFKAKFNKIDLERAFEDFEYINNNKSKLSNKSSKALNWIMEETLIKDLSEEVITIPKPLKGGELANVIASGKINGEISLVDGLGKHIVVGGVKKVNEVSHIDLEKKGEIEKKQKTIVKSEPYLNLLVNDKGRIKFKSLVCAGLKEDEESESEI